MENKRTKTITINEMLQNEVVAANKDWVDYLTNELALIERRAVKKRTVSKAKQSADTAIKSEVFIALVNLKRKATVTEILAAGSFEAGTSNQKISAILKKMIEDGTVTKVTDKKTSLFGLVSEAINPYDFEDEDKTEADE